MKKIQVVFSFLIGVMIIGFFANFAHNDYGLVLVKNCLLIIGLLCVGLAIFELKNFQKVLSILFTTVSAAMLLGQSYDTILAKLTAYKGTNKLVDIPVNFIEFMSLIGFSLLWVTLAIIIPLILRLYEKNKEKKSNLLKYFEWMILSALCMSDFMKMSHLAGTVLLSFLSMLIFIPCIFEIIKSYKTNYSPLIKLYHLLIFLSISLCTIGFKFKTQHWPGANILIGIGTVCLIIIIILSVFEKRSALLTIYKNLNTPVNLLFFTILVLLAFFHLRMNGLVPKLYSNEFPSQAHIYEAKANSITPEGIDNNRKLRTFYAQYQAFYQSERQYMEK